MAKNEIAEQERMCVNCSAYKIIGKNSGECSKHAITVWNTKKQDEVIRMPIVYSYHLCEKWT